MKDGSRALSEIFEYPGLTIVLGSQRSGKTAAGFWALERLHDMGCSCYFYSLHRNYDERLRRLLPAYIRLSHSLDFEQYPPASAILLDEAARWANSRNFAKGEAAEKLTGDIATIGQRNQRVFVLIQSAAMLDVAFFRMGVRLMMKKYSPISVAFERDGLNRVLAQLNSRLVRLHGKSWTAVVSDSDWGYVQVPLPSFWSDDLSVLWSYYHTSGGGNGGSSQ
jgi:hypothetical protein